MATARPLKIIKGLRSTRVVPKQGQLGVLVHLIFPTVEVLLMETGGATSFSLPSMGSLGFVMMEAAPDASGTEQLVNFCSRSHWPAFVRKTKTEKAPA